MNFKIIFAVLIMTLFVALTQSCCRTSKSKSIADRKFVFEVSRPDRLSIEETKKIACQQVKSKPFQTFFKEQFNFIAAVLDAESINKLKKEEIISYRARNFTNCLSIPAKYYGRRMYQKAACEKTNYSIDIDDKKEHEFYECVASKNNNSKNTMSITYPELENISVIFK